MTAARVAKLEELLGRVQKNRRAVAEVALGGAAKMTPVPAPAAAREAAAEKAEAEKAEAIDAAAVDARVRAPRPTPMEMALETAESSMDVEITVDDGPESTIDADGETLEDSIPTAPVETRAPVVEEKPAPARIVPPREPEPVAPRAIEVAAPKAAAVARVVSRAPALEPATFGELIDRTLALRPKR